jgi:hypothetical protein
MVSGLFEKKQDAIPPHPAPPQALPILQLIHLSFNYASDGQKE